MLTFLQCSARITLAEQAVDGLYLQSAVPQAAVTGSWQHGV